MIKNQLEVSNGTKVNSFITVRYSNDLTYFKWNENAETDRKTASNRNAYKSDDPFIFYNIGISRATIVEELKLQKFNRLW